MTERTLLSVAGDLATFDLVDLAASVGGLQLCPEHVGLQLRLDRAAALVASIDFAEGVRPRISAHGLRRLVNEPPIADQATVLAEDPPEDVFTNSITFVGGSYVVMPGNSADSVEILRALLTAIFHTEVAFPRPYRDYCQALTYAVLALSDSIASRAGLARMLSPADQPETRVRIPNASRLNELKKAVRYSRSDLEETVGPVDPDVLLDLSRVFGAHQIQPDDVALGEDDLYARPLLIIAQEMIVVMPSALLAALRHALIVKALDMDLKDELVESYRLASEAGSLHALRFLAHKGLGSLTTSPTWARETVLAFDGDKAAHLVVITDDLDAYTSANMLGHWSPDSLGTDLAVRLQEANAEIRSRSPEIDSILHLIVINGLGRSAGFGFPGDDLPAGDTFLSLRLSELEVISRLEAGNSLALWQFSQARDRLNSTTRVLAFGALDEFAIYHDCKHSFYLDDCHLPDFMTIPPGSGARLRQKVASDFDTHGVTNWSGAGIVDVQRLYEGTATPIYVPDPTLVETVALLLECPHPIWIHEAAKPPAELKHMYFQFCEAIAFWLWQIAPGIQEHLQHIHAHEPNFAVRVNLLDPGSWQQRAAAREPGSWISISQQQAGIEVQIDSGANVALMGEDNAGERALVAALANAVVDYTVRTGFSEAVDIQALIDEYAPLGLKKKILTLDATTTPELAPGPLPRVRVLQESDLSNVLDGLGNDLAPGLGLSPGDVPIARRTSLLGAAVAHFFELLETTVAALSPHNLLEFLIAHHEAIVREQAQLRLTLPTRLACFPDAPAHMSDLQSRAEQLMRSDLSARFLIEYVTARPPAGTKTIGFEKFDYLMALASEIFDKGTFSDAIHYLDADMDLSILPSGRLGTARDGRYMSGFEVFRELQSSLDISSAHAGFKRHWRTPTTDGSSVDIEELDRAAQAEFGFSMTEAAHFFGDLMKIAMSAGQEPCAQTLDNLRNSLATSLSLDHGRVDHMLDFFSLHSRATFVPADKSAVYPWIFNRALSYVRKPLLVRQTDGRIEVLFGLRHLARAGTNLLVLCTSGRLKFQTSREMTRFTSRMRERESRSFEDTVAQAFDGDNRLLVRQRVKKIGARHIERRPGEPLGDVDVLVADPKRRRILAIEAKDFEIGRTPHELANEVEKLLAGHESAMELHQQRLEWLANHLADVLEWLGVPQSSRRWRVNGLVVISRELMSPYVRSSALRVMSIELLRENIGSAWG